MGQADMARNLHDPTYNCNVACCEGSNRVKIKLYKLDLLHAVCHNIW